jgi:hypothetical protein
MLADFFTKPLQGSLFRKFRAVLLGHAHVDTLSARPGPSSPEERVERQILAAITPDPNAIVSRSAAEPNSVSEPNSLPAYYRQTSTKIATVSALLVLTNTDKRVYRIHSDLRERLFCPTSVPPIVHACMHVLYVVDPSLLDSCDVRKWLGRDDFMVSTCPGQSTDDLFQ